MTSMTQKKTTTKKTTPKPKAKKPTAKKKTTPKKEQEHVHDASCGHDHELAHVAAPELPVPTFAVAKKKKSLWRKIFGFGR